MSASETHISPFAGLTPAPSGSNSANSSHYPHAMISNELVSVPRRLPARPLTIALAGNPNAGKTTLFNALTGLRQKVANYPGVTVEKKSGSWSLGAAVPPAQLIDLPGLYSLKHASLDEQIASEVLSGKIPQLIPDVIVVAVDATNLVRNLYLAAQLIELGKPVVIALTMFDVAARTVRIDVAKLQRLLGVPVVPVVCSKQEGLRELARQVLVARRKLRIVNRANIGDVRTALVARYHWIDNVVSQCVTPIHAQQSGNRSERLDRVLTHPVLGPLVLAAVLLLVFQAIFSWASVPMNLIDATFSSLARVVHNNFPPGVFTDLLTDGIIAGVGGVLVFLPQILLLFLLISVLEDTGYMARAAFLTDRVMRSFGLHGKAFVPLLSSFACAVPGIMATRTIESPRDRIATIMIAPFMSCSARLPIYSLMIAAFFPQQTVLGFISLGALMILAMYFLGIVVAVIVAWVLKHTVLDGPAPPFVMELPAYRLPRPTNVLLTMVNRAGVFVKQAGTVILAMSILLWALAFFPRSSSADVSATQQIENSYAGRTGRLIEPVIRPLGFDWRIGIGLISSFAARETIISTLAIVYNVGPTESDSRSLNTALRNARRADGSHVWTPLVAISLMVFFALACQCMSTLAVVRRETNSWRWPVFMIAYMFVLAYIASFITYQGGRLLGFE